MRFGILLLVLFLFTSANKSKNGDCLELDIILLADVSDSTGGYTRFIKDAFNAFVNRYYLSESGIKIGVVTFSTDVVFQTHLTSNKHMVKQAIKNIGGTNGLTNMVRAFEEVGLEFAINGRTTARNVVILVSDGLPTNIKAAMKLIPEYKTIYNIDVCGVYIDKINKNIKTNTPASSGSHGFGNYNYGNEEFMRFISDNFCYVVSNYKSLPNKFKILNICA